MERVIERAEWRRRADDPRTPLGVHFGRERWGGLPVGLCVVGYAAFAEVTVRLVAHPWGVSLLVGFLLPLFKTDRKDYDPPRDVPIPPSPDWGNALLRRLMGPSRYAGVEALAPDPSPSPGFPVVITLERGRRTTGGDVGIVAFSEGWLVYEGNATAFALSPADAARVGREGRSRMLSLPEGQRLSLKSYEEGWEAAFEAWLADEAPSGVSRLPPLLPNRIRILRAAGRLQVGACTVLGFGLGAAFTGSAAVLVVLATFSTFAAILYVAGMLAARRRTRDEAGLS